MRGNVDHPEFSHGHLIWQALVTVITKIVTSPFRALGGLFGGDNAESLQTLRPFRQANRLPAPIEAWIVRLKREYPSWGAPKIREKLRQQAAVAHLPAISTVHAVLDRHGLVKRRRRRCHPARGTELSPPPNRTPCGAPTTKANSCSATAATATP